MSDKELSGIEVSVVVKLVERVEFMTDFVVGWAVIEEIGKSQHLNLAPFIAVDAEAIRTCKPQIAIFSGHQLSLPHSPLILCKYVIT